jgi:hypothetical protein
VVRKISFVTCVADWPEYSACRASIEALERGALETEVLPIDNAGNPRTAPAALNLGWSQSRGDLVVFCHEDVVFPRRWLADLLAQIAVLDAQSARWGVLGIMGRVDKRYFGHACGPDGKPACHGPLPAAVETLDELCLIVPASLPFRFDEALGGYHLYGVDLCLQVIEGGALEPFAIDAPCQHNSRTRHRPAAYHVVKRRLQRKWMFRRRKVGRSVGTTCGRIRFGLFEGWV